MSPRRSSRARSTAHHPQSNQSTSSHSSSSSARGFRHKSRLDDPQNDDPLTRDESMDGAELDNAGDLEQDDAASGNEEDEGETRCVCGYKEYQGGSDDGSSDATDGLFIQCDQCKAWQHGLCVGIRDTALAPDNYFCELCKPENHTLYEKKGGRTYSTYVGFGPDLSDASKDHPTKRRSTMNSRDAAYDELVLARVLEESKFADKKNGTRSRKRGTSEASDESNREFKRQRTSDSPEKMEDKGSADEGIERPSSSRKRNNRSSSHQGNSSKRSSGRNRSGTDRDKTKKNDIVEEPPRATRSNHKTEEQTAQIAATPTIETPDTPSHTKRATRNTTGVGTRRRNRNAQRQSEDPGEASPHTMTRDHSTIGIDGKTDVIDKPAKPRLPGSRTTLQDMRRRVTGISEFISRTQLEMAEEKKRLQILTKIVQATSLTDSPSKSDSDTAKDPEQPSPASSESCPTPKNTTGTDIGFQVIVVTDKNDAENANTMHSTDIMDMLMRKVHHWEQTFGKQGEKV